jgi:uncharacterized membrane protein HdeD (DUF308 family)
MENQTSLGASLIKFIMLKGIFLLVTGLVLLIFPNATLTTLIFVMGIYWLIDGVSTIVNSIKKRETHSAWAWGIFTGVLVTIAGLVVLSRPILSALLTTSFLMWFLGVSALIHGFSSLITGLRLPKSTGRTSMIWGGVFSVLFGVIIMSSPYMSAVTLVYIIGAIAVIGGVSILFVASKMKNKLK